MAAKRCSKRGGSSGATAAVALLVVVAVCAVGHVSGAGAVEEESGATATQKEENDSTTLLNRRHSPRLGYEIDHGGVHRPFQHLPRRRDHRRRRRRPGRRRGGRRRPEAASQVLEEEEHKFGQGEEEEGGDSDEVGRRQDEPEVAASKFDLSEARFRPSKYYRTRLFLEQDGDVGQEVEVGPDPEPRSSADRRQPNATRPNGKVFVKHERLTGFTNSPEAKSQAVSVSLTEAESSPSHALRSSQQHAEVPLEPAIGPRTPAAVGAPRRTPASPVGAFVGTRTSQRRSEEEAVPDEGKPMRVMQPPPLLPVGYLPETTVTSALEPTVVEDVSTEDDSNVVLVFPSSPSMVEFGDAVDDTFTLDPNERIFETYFSTKNYRDPVSITASPAQTFRSTLTTNNIRMSLLNTLDLGQFARDKSQQMHSIKQKLSGKQPRLHSASNTNTNATASTSSTLPTPHPLVAARNRFKEMLGRTKTLVVDKVIQPLPAPNVTVANTDERSKSPRRVSDGLRVVESNDFRLGKTNVNASSEAAAKNESFAGRSQEMTPAQKLFGPNRDLEQEVLGGVSRHLSNSSSLISSTGVSVGVVSRDRARLSDVASGASALGQASLFALYLTLLEVHALVAREMSARAVEMSVEAAQLSVAAAEAVAAELHELAAHTVELLKVLFALLVRADAHGVAVAHREERARVRLHAEVVKRIFPFL